jgi:hypothetical protein
VTVTVLALLLIFIGIIIKKYVIIYCLTETKEELPVKFDTLYISISILVLLLSVLVIGMVCLYKYKQLKNFLCCNLYRGRKETTSQTYGEETADPFLHPEEGGSTHDAGHSHDMTYHSP